MRRMAFAMVLLVSAALSSARESVWLTRLDSACVQVRTAFRVHPVTRRPAAGPRSYLSENLARVQAAETDRTQITMEPLDVAAGAALGPQALAVAAQPGPGSGRVAAAGHWMLQLPPPDHLLMLVGLLCLGVLVALLSVAVALLGRGVESLERARADLALLTRHGGGEYARRPTAWSAFRSAESRRRPVAAPPPGHEVPTRLACELPRMRERLVSMPADDAAVVSLRNAVDRLSTALQSAGYEVRDRRGEAFHDGMAMGVAAFVESPCLAPGEQRVLRMVRPEVRYRGAVIEPGVAEVGIGGRKPERAGGAALRASADNHQSHAKGGLPWIARR